MCGIAGIFAPGRSVDPNAVRAMTDAIAHRGPDDSGLEVLSNGELVLGHRRLSILDLSPLGHQPMAHPSGKAWIVFNGEIYNFKEIRADLVAEGERFCSESDTEVVLAAYSRWGVRFLERFRGMFAFALWDATRGEILLFRDRFGVKPLYYHLGSGGLTFASEMRGILVGQREAGHAISAAAAMEFLRYGYVSAPNSLLADVLCVPPGCIVRVDRALGARVERYWSPSALYDPTESAPLRREIAALDDETLLDRFEDGLTEAFDLRMVADVPVGLFLSGGIDSSIVATLLARKRGLRLRTFTIGYADSGFNEIPYAREIAQELGCDHTELEVSDATALEVYDTLSAQIDEPIGDSSAIPTYIVCKLARQSLKVALSADGADELFGGYPRYQICARFAESIGGWTRFAYLASAELLDLLPASLIRELYALTRRGGPGYAAIGDKVRKFVRMARSGSPSDAYDAAVSECSAVEVRSLIARGPNGSGALVGAPSPPGGLDPRDLFMLTDISRYLVGDLLTKLDRTSMAVSLEARDPFLDHIVAAMAAALPMHWKIRRGQGKYILRRILARHLSTGLFNRPKQGFSAPVGTWMRGVLRPQVEAALSPNNVRRCGLLDATAVSRTVERFMSNRNGISPAGLWHLLQLQNWGARHCTSGPVSN
jgi:asparagine synthase (glutamine-hydrolysing)